MRAVSMMIASVCCVAFAGCAVKGPELRVGPEIRVKPPVEVKVEGDNSGGGKFCPPGQAKKGRC